MDLSHFNPEVVYFPTKHLKTYLASMVKKLTSANNLYKVQKNGLVDKILMKYKLNRGRREEVCFITNQTLWMLDNTDGTNFLRYSYRRRLLEFYNTNLKGVIKTQFVGNYNYRFKIFPFVYQSDYRLDSPEILMRIRNLRKTDYSSSIFARWDSRKDKRVIHRQHWAKSCKKIPNIDIKDSKTHLSWEEYMRSIATAQFALSANGRGPLCSRDMEIAAIGTPMLREKLKAQMYVPFIPGTHYIEVSLSNIVEQTQYYQNNYNEAVQIGMNAQNYFDSHITAEGMQKIFHEIIANIS